MKSWLDANPNEVLSILVVNSDGFPPTAYDSLYKSVGLDTVSYAPPSASMPASQWPTLGTLIDSGTPLITFMDANADFTSVPYIISGTLRIFSKLEALSVIDQNSPMSGKPLTMLPRHSTAASTVQTGIHPPKCT